MTGVAVRYDLSDLSRITRALDRMADVDTADLMQAMAAVGESQTRRRLTNDKAAPDGTPWPAWSEMYAGTRHGGHSLLEGEGDLVDSITHDFSDVHAEWGTPLVYGPTHQLGARKGQFGSDRHGRPIPWGDIPARGFVGMSESDEQELVDVIIDFLDDDIRRSLQ